ncbi:BON domain-containing protein [Coleofasciculus sp. FACHB-1120]|uniref:BON domain-containing protein n=1 Tax=Coleofasciculus sp. FACHB-1120 TaxID=2692783 RepID=UPI001686025D|nr:BON domain-containing protein [Coleofasciculus sp. FACHB-1120]MBD2743882.1 BON domain-containing protein [Coleofasciculus sp. FACHB-1120]
MNKITPFLLGGFLLFTAACGTNVSRTDSNAPDSPGETIGTPSAENAREGKQESTSQVRRDQLDADIRAREQRDQALTNDNQRTDADLASEVRSKLEANLPASFLTVKANEGVVIVAGTVPTQEQYQRIEPLAREIRGVKDVNIQAKVQPAQPK